MSCYEFYCRYPGTGDEPIELSIKGALGLAASADIFGVLVSKDKVPVHIALNEHLPDGIHLHIGLTAANARNSTEADPKAYFDHPVEDWLDSSYNDGLAKESALAMSENIQSNGGDEIDARNERPDFTDEVSALRDPIPEHEPLLRRLNDDPSTLPGGFQKQLLKFDRLSAHLANERTWLAWVRTTLSLLSIAFTVRGEMSSAKNSGWMTTLFVVGCATIICVEITYFTGWVRYHKVKAVLQTESLALQPKLGRFKLKLQTYSTFAVLVAIALAYWLGGYHSF